MDLIPSIKTIFLLQKLRVYPYIIFLPICYFIGVVFYFNLIGGLKMQLHKFEFILELRDGEIPLQNTVVKQVLKLIVPNNQVIMFDCNPVNEVELIKSEV